MKDKKDKIYKQHIQAIMYKENVDEGADSYFDQVGEDANIAIVLRDGVVLYFINEEDYKII